MQKSEFVYVRNANRSDNFALEINDRFIYSVGKYANREFKEGVLKEISPSGEYIKIDDYWYLTHDITLLEYLSISHPK